MKLRKIFYDGKKDSGVAVHVSNNNERINVKRRAKNNKLYKVLEDKDGMITAEKVGGARIINNK